MESPHTPCLVVLAFDATKDLSQDEVNLAIKAMKTDGGILRVGDTLLALGVLHKVLHPMGYQLRACPDSFTGTSIRAMEEEVSKKVDLYVKMLQKSAALCENPRVSMEVQISAGYPIRQVISQELAACKATWCVLDRHLRRDLAFYEKHISCKIALIEDGFSLTLLRRHGGVAADIIEEKQFYSLSKPVPLSNDQGSENMEPTEISHSYSLSLSSQENMPKSNLTPSSSLDYRPSSIKESGSRLKRVNRYGSSSQTVQRPPRHVSQQRSSEAPILCAACGTRTDMHLKDSMRFSFSEIQLATKDFSQENLLGEGGYGLVYKGELQDGQLIAAKVRKEESNQGFAEFHSEVYVLNFARHKNIVMLLGYCSKESQNILVYEYICNKSLGWHLFDNPAPLEWHQRIAIAIGIAKGLRFLHEECRGGPIIHRDLRPSNILLTHDFVPMLADFGLAKWKTGDDPLYTRVLGTFGYLAPEYTESGMVSVRTDVYAFGIVLLQLISGRKAINLTTETEHQTLRQWAEPLIKGLQFRELIDLRIKESYDEHELHIMAKTAYLCIQGSPEMRPSMGEVVRLLDVGNDHFQHLQDEFRASYTY